jgi:hypothetical protein
MARGHRTEIAPKELGTEDLEKTFQRVWLLPMKLHTGHHMP